MNAKYVVVEDYWIKIRENLYMLVERAFVYDGASGVYDVCMVASASHDRLYKRQEVTVTDGKGHFHTIKLSRKLSDKIYRNLLPKSLILIRKVRYIGLRLFGGFSYNKKDALFLNRLPNIPHRKCYHQVECYILYDGRLYKRRFEYIKL